MKKNVKSDIADFFYLSESVIGRHNAKGTPIQKIYNYLKSEVNTTTQKKRYLYTLKCIDSEIKDNLWERYMGDKGFLYNSIQKYESTSKIKPLKF